MNNTQIANMVEKLAYGKGIIKSDDNHVLVKPSNTWETNYKLIDRNECKTYLIDVDDMAMSYDICKLKEMAWKVK